MTTVCDKQVRRVLIIDDTDSIHADIRKVLTGSDDGNELDDLESRLFGGGANAPADRLPFEFQIDSAMQGEEGAEKVAAALREGSPYAMAFVDMRMPPGWDGLQTIEAIWRVDPDIQIAICTAYTEYSWKDIIQRLGWTDRFLVLRKPFDTIEAAQLAAALCEKWKLGKQAQARLGELESLIAERTAELKRAAMHDRLTGLPNRALLLERLSAALSRAQRDAKYKFAVLFLDLDRFKIINDSLGHACGDLLLQQVSERLTHSIRANDAVARDLDNSTAARLGGDEFIILLEPIRNLEDALRVAERVQSMLDKPYLLNGHEVRSTSSIGITYSDCSYADALDILRDADTAMYRAKAEGKGKYVIFDQKMHQQAMARLTVEADLRLALQRRELLLEYQPIVNLPDASLSGFESLVRWDHPTRGRVAPLDFISIAEETGLILPIGEWILEESCRQLARWRKNFPSLPALSVSVNVSRKQLACPNLLPLIKRLLSELKFEPSLLRLEITESVIMDDPAAALSVLEALDAMGVGLQMDDFGTGYSSLSCVHRFPLSALKIDRSFISGMDQPDHQAVVKAIVALGHSLRLELVAEGVETAEQVTTLQAMGCERAQGYFFGKPMNPAAAEQFLQSAEAGNHR